MLVKMESKHNAKKAERGGREGGSKKKIESRRKPESDMRDMEEREGYFEWEKKALQGNKL